jgi:hypothetical protein
MMEPTPQLDARLRSVLEPGEELRVHASAAEATIAVTDRRLIVAASTRVALAVPFDAVRRIQFDVERRRPATLVIVPEHPTDEAQVLSVPPEDYDAAARALVAVGRALAGLEGPAGAPRPGSSAAGD